MDPSQPLANAVFALFAAVLFMGAWDGLVRHHIRVRPNEQFASLLIEGPAAVLLGGMSLLVLVLLCALAVSGLPALTAGCQTPACLLQRIVLLPFTTLSSLFILALTAGLFVPWARGMFDLDGPFRTRMLAPGVWYREREVVALARQALERQRQAEVGTRVILELADSLLREFHGISPTMPTPGAIASPPTCDMVVRSLTHSALVHKRRGATEVAQRIIIDAIAPYSIEKLEAAERRWPWRRRFLTTVP